MLGLLAHMGSGPSTSSGWMGSGMMEPGMMMWGPSSTGQSLWWIGIFLSWLTWVLLLVVLVALIRWLWKKGEK